MGKRNSSRAANFESVRQTDVPHGRNGKHKNFVGTIMSDLENLAPGRALKIPLVELPDTNENVRSAVNRVTRQRGLQVATSSDEGYLYIWNLATWAIDTYTFTSRPESLASTSLF